MGFPLWRAQEGKKHPDAKPLKGFSGAGVLEIVADEEGDAYRAISTIRLKHAVYVLHAFQKKSKRGVKTSDSAMDLVRQRLRDAIELDRHATHGGTPMNIEHERGSGNVFADLGLPNADELFAKAKIVGQISDMIEERHVTQMQAAKTLGIDQPSLSRLLRGRTSGFSMDRLIRMLNAFDYDVTITVSPKPSDRSHAHVTVQPFTIPAPISQRKQG